MSALEKVAFTDHSHEHIDYFVVEEETCKGQKHLGNVQEKDFADGGVVVG